jgi:hypothetical protein
MKSKISFYFALLLLSLLTFYQVGCSAGKQTRYEEVPKEETKEIKVPVPLKTMEVREREFIQQKKISTVERINFEYDSNGKLVNKGKLSASKYDAKGFLIETLVFDEKGRVQNKFEYKYNDKGLRTESLRFNEKNKFDKKYTYKYDKSGNKIKSIRYNANSGEEKYYLYDYDSELNLISDEWYDISGELEYKIENNYDDSGKKILSSSYNESGKLQSKNIFKYDERRNIIEEQKFDDNNKPVGIIQYVYKYY